MKIIQQIRQTTALSDVALFSDGVLTVDTDLWQIRLHDGVTPGGHVIPNESTIVGYGVTEFNAVASFGTPGAINVAHVGKLLSITAAGTYELPSVVGIPIGTRFLIRALLAGVILEPATDEFINDLGVDQITTSLDDKELLTLAVYDTTHWVILNRYKP